MDEVRLDYFLSVGGLLVEDDEYIFDGASVGVCSPELMNSPNGNDKDVILTSFTDRENKGVQPVPDGFPVVVYNKKGYLINKGDANSFYWSKMGMWCIASWKPDYNKLLEMQKEHDAKQELSGDMKKIRYFALEPDTDIEELMINTKESKMSNVFTQEMKDSGYVIELGMLYLDDKGDECKLVGENNFSDCYIGKPTNSNTHERHLSLSVKDRCNPIKSKEELELEEAKDKQVKEFSQFLRELSKSTGFDEAAKALQEKGMLAEIVLPLEGE